MFFSVQTLKFYQPARFSAHFAPGVRQPTSFSTISSHAKTTKSPCHASINLTDPEAAYRELWQEEARRQFNRDYDVLAHWQRRSVHESIPMVISEAEPTDYIPQ